MNTRGVRSTAEMDPQSDSPRAGSAWLRERVAMAIFNASVKSAGRSVLWDRNDGWPSESIRDEARACADAALSVGAHADLVRALQFIANHTTSEEGDREKTEEDIGLDCEEVIEMAHDNMIWRARSALEALAKFAESLQVVQPEGTSHAPDPTHPDGIP